MKLALEHSDRFVHFANAYGPILTFDNHVWHQYLAPSLKNCESNWKRHRGFSNQVGDVFDFELGYIENKSFPNAICGFNNGLHIILVYHTYIFAMFEFFNRLFCYTDFLAETGNPITQDQEKASKFASPLGFAIMMGEVKISYLDQIPEIFGPKCPIRKKLASEFFQTSISLIWEHEISHAINGHVLYADRVLGHKSLQKSPDPSTIGPETLGPYTHMELSADKGAIFSVITRALLRRKKVPYAIMSSDDYEEFQLLRNQILAASLLGLFLMLSDTIQADGDVRATEIWDQHPSSVSRTIHYVMAPFIQSNPLEAEFQHYINQGTSLAIEELLNLADKYGIFRPFRWVLREDMYASLMKEHALSTIESKSLHQELSRFRFSIPM